MLKKWLGDTLFKLSSKEPEQQPIKIELAAAVLFYEMGRADFQVDEVEKGQVKTALCQLFSIPAEKAEDLLKQAEKTSQDSHDYHQFTSLIHEQFSYAEKVKLIKQMWRIAVADGRVDAHEEHLLRKISDLIYVDNKDFLQTKHQVIDGESGRSS